MENIPGELLQFLNLFFGDISIYELMIIIISLLIPAPSRKKMVLFLKVFKK